MPTPDMGFTPKQTKQLMELAEKTMAGDKEAEADLMLETPTEFMEKMNVKEPKAIAKKLKETYGADGKPKMDKIAQMYLDANSTETPKATRPVTRKAKPAATVRTVPAEEGYKATKKVVGKAKSATKKAGTRKKSSGGNPKAQASGMGY